MSLFKIPLIIIAVLLPLVSCGQTTESKTDKEVYKIDEEIEVTFSIDAKLDTTLKPDLEGFEIVRGPNTSSNMTFSVGKMVSNSSLSYVLKPVKSGNLTIQGPVFVVDGKKYRAKSVQITVLPIALTAEELRAQRFNEFKETSIKPKETRRYVFHGEFGYIEKYADMEWQIVRDLTPEEIKLLKDME